MVMLYGNIPKRLLKHKNINVVYINNINEYFLINTESFKIPVINKKADKIIN